MPRLGRPSKLDDTHIQLLRELVAAFPLSTVAELNRHFFERSGVAVTTVTLGKALRKAEIVRVIPERGQGYQKPPALEDGEAAYGYDSRHRVEPADGRYPSSLTDQEWQWVEDLFAPSGGRGAPPQHSRRLMVDACCYVVRTGCSWRQLPADFPPWTAAYKAFRTWSDAGCFERMHDRLREQWRLRAERNPEPRNVVLDSQSTRGSPQGGDNGYDAGKRVKGRKRNLVVDSLGCLLAITVTAAGVQDRAAAAAVMDRACEKYPTIERLYADSAYAGDCARRLEAAHNIQVNIVRHPGNRNVGQWHQSQLPLFEQPASRAFISMPMRWMVERSHAWIERSRRLVMHHDRVSVVSEAWVWLSEARRLLRNLAS